MLPEQSIERVFRREIDALPVPAPAVWVPTGFGRRRLVAPVVAIAAALLVIAAAVITVDPGNAAGSHRVTQTLPTLPTRPGTTCPPDAASTPRGVCSAPVPVLIANGQLLGYNLVIPSNWREVSYFIPTSTPFLIARRIYTARGSDAGVLTMTEDAPAWDLDVQIWDRQGRSPLEWSRTFGNCGSQEVSFATSCQTRSDVLRGMLVVVTTSSFMGRSDTTSYYVAHGDRMLILRYQADQTVTPPPGVTTDVLEGVIRSIGLV
jgi:hypothetical protein